MCGIFGWFGSSDPSTADLTMSRMAATLRHRGPDGENWRILERAALGHTRLAIIDPVGGHQPMIAPDHGATLVYNGEIYNYRTLREALQAEGVTFRTHSDTEVIIAGYVRHGVEFFNRLRGMYAFAIWDPTRRCGVLARDPAGIKPLFISRLADGRTAFASEAKALRLLADAPLDIASLHLVMNFRYLPGDGSLFTGIEQVSPGSVIEWRDGKHISNRIEQAIDSKSKSLLDVLEDSVLHHLESDVPVAAFLSGGIDSATVTALAAQHGKLHSSYTLRVGDDPREADNAARTAKLLGVANRIGGSLEVDSSRLRDVVWHLEIPKINALQVDQLSEFTAQYVEVALSGLGGDELFAGYNAHHIFRRLTSLARIAPRTLAHVAATMTRASATVSWTEPERALRILAARGDWSRAYGILRNVWDSPAHRSWLYGPRMLDATLPDAFTTLAELWPDGEPLEAMRKFEWEQKMVNDLLWQEDRMSMRHGLEARVPFVDTEVHAFVSCRSMRELMLGGRSKGWLRSEISELLPREILDRPKSGFQIDAPRFVYNELRTLADEWLSEERVRAVGLFNPATVARLRRLPARTSYRWHFLLLYLMLMTHVWVDVFEESSNAQ